MTAPLPLKQAQILYVPPGSSIYSITQVLHAKGYLAHPTFFILLAKLEGKVKHLKTGEYQLEPGLSAQGLLTKIVEGKVILRQFTIVEGWTFKQVLAALNSNPYLLHTLAISNSSAEGRLYPDTYLFAAGVSDAVILRKASAIMQKKLATVWATRQPGLPYPNAYSALIVASLIEKETARPEERSQIAGVIIRRLAKKMPLQIDAAVIYGLGNAYTGKLTYNDLKKDTPFNTYLHLGLPPTPIAMPSLAAVIAALHPTPGTTLYYVARGDGSHAFSNTLQEHHHAVNQFRAAYANVAGRPVVSDPLMSIVRKIFTTDSPLIEQP